MADVKINGLVLKSTPDSTDELEIQETANGVSRKITLGTIPAKHAIHVKLSTDNSIPNGATGAQLDLDTTVDSTGTAITLDTSGTYGELEINADGWYAVTYRADISTSGIGANFYGWIAHKYNSGANTNTYFGTRNYIDSDALGGSIATVFIHCEDTDKIQAHVRHNSSITEDSRAAYTYLMAYKLF